MPVWLQKCQGTARTLGRRYQQERCTASTEANSSPRRLQGEASQQDSGPHHSEAQGLADGVVYGGSRVHGDPRCSNAGLPAVKPTAGQGLLGSLHFGSL